MVRTSYWITALTVTAALLLTAAPLRAALSSEDKDLIKDAVRNIKSSSDDCRVVRDKTDDEHIRSFASNVVGGNTKLVDQLRDIAQKNDFSFSEDATSPDRKGTKELQGMRGRELDRAFLQNTIRDHEELLTIFKKGAKDARNSDLRDFFERKQDAIRDHLDKAQSLLRDMKDKSRD